MATIADNLTRIQTAKDDIRDAILAKGGTLSTEAHIEAYAGAIEALPSGTDVQELNVTANGTYTAPEGTAYSPVIVDVQGGGSGVIDAFVRTYMNDPETMELLDLTDFPTSGGKLPFSDVNRIKVLFNDGSSLQSYGMNNVRHLYITGRPSYISDSLCNGQYLLVDLPTTAAEYRYSFNNSPNINKIKLKSGNDTIICIGNAEWGGNLTEAIIDAGALTNLQECFRQQPFINKIALTASTAPSASGTLFCDLSNFTLANAFEKIIVVPTGATGYDTGDWAEITSTYGWSIEYKDDPVDYVENDTDSTCLIMRGGWGWFSAGEKIVFNGTSEYTIANDTEILGFKFPITIDGTTYNSPADITRIHLEKNGETRYGYTINLKNGQTEFSAETPLNFNDERYQGMTAIDIRFYNW